MCVYSLIAKNDKLFTSVQIPELIRSVYATTMTTTTTSPPPTTTTIFNNNNNKNNNNNNYNNCYCSLKQ